MRKARAGFDLLEFLLTSSFLLLLSSLPEPSPPKSGTQPPSLSDTGLTKILKFVQTGWVGGGALESNQLGEIAPPNQPNSKAHPHTQPFWAGVGD